MKRRILAGLLVAIPFATYWLLKAPVVDSFLTGRLPHWARSAGVELSLATADFDPWGPSLRLTGVRARGRDGTWELTADSVAVRLHALKSLGGTPHLAVEAAAPRFRGTFSPASEAAPAKEKPKARSIPGVVLETLRVSDGRVEVSLPDRDLGLTLPRIEVAWVHNQGTAHLDGGSLRWAGEEEPLEVFSFAGERRFAAVRVDRLAVRTGHLNLSASGQVGPWRLLDLELDARATLRGLPEAWVRAARMERFAPVDTEVSLSATVTGNTAAPRAAGTVRVARGRLGTMEIEDAAGSWEADREGISFRGLTARTSLGSAAETSGRLGWHRGVTLQAEGRALDYDLRRFMAFLGQSPFPVGVRASGTFRAEGSLAPELALHCEARLGAHDLDVTVGEPGEERTVFSLPAATVSSRLTVGKSELTFDTTRVETPSVTVDIPSGRILYKEGLWFDTRVVLRNLDAVRQYLPPDLDARGEADGRFGGPYRELTFAYDLDLASAVVMGEDLGRLRAAARYDLHDLTLTRATLEGPLGTLSAEGSVGLHREGRYALQVQAAVPELEAVAGLFRRRGAAVPENIGGSGTAVGRVVGPLPTPEFDGEVTLARPAAWGYALDQATLRGTGSPAGWRMGEGLVEAYGARVGLAGEGDRQTFHLSGSVQGLRTERLAAAAAARLPMTAVISGAVEVGGAYDDPHAEWNGTADAVIVAGRRVGAVSGTLRYRRGVVDARAEGVNGSVRVRGELGLKEEFPFAADLEVAGLPWRVLSGEGLPPEWVGEAISGRGQVAGALAGGRRGLQASWTGAVTGLRWRDLELGRVSFGGQWAGEGLSVSAEAWNGEAEGKLLLSSQRDAPAELELTLSDLRLARLRALAPLPGGRVRAHARVLASLEELRRAEGWERLGALAEVEAEGAVTGLVMPGGVALPEWSFRVVSPGGHPALWVKSQGVDLSLALSGEEPGSWTGEGRIEDFAPTAWLPEDHSLRRLQGRVTGRFSAQGVGRRVDSGSGEGRVAGLAWDSVLAPSDWDWTAEWADGGVRATAHEPRGVAVQARWEPGQALVADVVLRDLPLEGWVADPRFPADLTGSASGDGRVRVDADGRVGAEVRLSDLRVRAPPVDWRNDGPVQLAYREGEIQVERLQMTGDQFRLGASGKLRPGESWDLRVEGTADLEAVQRWVKAVRRSSGAARARLHVGGPWKSPRIRGPITVEPGATLLLEAVDIPIQDLEASAHFDPDRGLIVEWIDAQVGDGRLHLEGVVGLEGVRPGKLRILAEARNIAYESPPQVSYMGDADLLLTGTAERPEIRGDIRLKEFLYGRRLNLKTIILDALKRRPREVKGVPEVGTVFVDVAVRGSDNLRVDNNLADLSLAADLRARGYLPRPVLWGRVEATGGTFRFRSQEYDVLRSSVEFLGESQPVPLLDVHVRTTQREYTINVDVTGPLDRYQVAMASLPPLPQNDIVALLTLGTTSEEVTGAQGVTAAEAASFVTGGLQEEVEGGVGELLGLDQFHIDPAYSPATQTTMPRVTVGKAITRALFARYSAAMGGETEQDLEVQYTLNPRVLLLGTWTDRGSQAQGSLGGEVRFRFSFR